MNEVSIKSNKVIVSIVGGVPYINAKPDDITVVIRDYDIEGGAYTPEELVEGGEDGDYFEKIYE